MVEHAVLPQTCFVAYWLFSGKHNTGCDFCNVEKLHWRVILLSLSQSIFYSVRDLWFFEIACNSSFDCNLYLANLQTFDLY